jgi:hypothetical protein
VAVAVAVQVAAVAVAALAALEKDFKRLLLDLIL